jgi:endonuclease/exonuclease/phosphatase family metal-dependent hydrolase
MTEFVICGDVNIYFLSDSYRKQQLSQLLGSYNMLHTVNFPTRFQNNHSSAIDNIFVSNSRLRLCNILPLYNGLSDRDAQPKLLIITF